MHPQDRHEDEQQHHALHQHQPEQTQTEAALATCDDPTAPTTGEFRNLALCTTLRIDQTPHYHHHRHRPNLNQKIFSLQALLLSPRRSVPATTSHPLTPNHDDEFPPLVTTTRIEKNGERIPSAFCPCILSLRHQKHQTPPLTCPICHPRKGRSDQQSTQRQYIAAMTMIPSLQTQWPAPPLQTVHSHPPPHPHPPPRPTYFLELTLLKLLKNQNLVEERSKCFFLHLSDSHHHSQQQWDPHCGVLGR